MKRQDIPGWFPESTEKMLTELLGAHKISQVIEIGAFQGKATAFFGEHVLETLAIDPFIAWQEGIKWGAVTPDEDFHQKFLDNIESVRSEKKLGAVRSLRLTSQEAFDQNPNLRADLIYIDAAHDYESVKRDIDMWKTRADKIICGDDFDVHWPGVIRAVEESFDRFEISGNFWFKIL